MSDFEDMAIHTRRIEEMCVIGGLLNHPEDMHDVMYSLSRYEFQNVDLGYIYNMMVGLYTDGKKVTANAVLDILDAPKGSEADKVLQDIKRIVSVTTRAMDHVKMLKGKDNEK